MSRVTKDSSSQVVGPRVEGGQQGTKASTREADYARGVLGDFERQQHDGPTSPRIGERIPQQRRGRLGHHRSSDPIILQ